MVAKVSCCSRFDWTGLCYAPRVYYSGLFICHVRLPWSVIHVFFRRCSYFFRGGLAIFVELCGAVMRSHDSSRQWTFELVEEYLCMASAKSNGHNRKAEVWSTPAIWRELLMFVITCIRMDPQNGASTRDVRRPQVADVRERKLKLKAVRVPFEDKPGKV